MKILTFKRESSNATETQPVVIFAMQVHYIIIKKYIYNKETAKQARQYIKLTQFLSISHFSQFLVFVQAHIFLLYFYLLISLVQYDLVRKWA